MNDHGDLLAIATEAAEAASELLRARRASGVSVIATKSSELDIVTRADGDAEALIRSMILAARPDDGFLGEESAAAGLPGTSGVTWIVDPLDGTVNYLYGAGPYAVSIAAVSGPPEPAEWTALVGVVVVCTEQVTFAATRDGGATADGAPIAASREDRLDLALVSTGLAYDRLVRREQAETIAGLAPDVRDLRMGGSAATDLCLVAAGRLDAYYERRLGPWDYAAGALIVREAGGSVRNGAGGAPDGDLVLAAGAGLIDALGARV